MNNTFYRITEKGLNYLQSVITDMESKFYATFQGINSREIAVFNTAQERDDWVNFNDPFARLDPEYKDFGIPRKALSTTYAIKRICKFNDYKVVTDECNDNQRWIILRA
ncbi:hypothetical protein IJ556_04055 [bacterium]|nr:hypothetical protein [bacterium]